MTWANWAAFLAKYGTAILAAVNAGRLNTPETSASTWDYLLYVALPALLTPAAAGAQWITSPRVRPISKPEEVHADIAPVVKAMIGRGHIAEAIKLLQALPGASK
jgi:hypothetical protein